MHKAESKLYLYGKLLASCCQLAYDLFNSNELIQGTDLLKWIFPGPLRVNGHMPFTGTCQSLWSNRHILKNSVAITRLNSWPGQPLLALLKAPVRQPGPFAGAAHATGPYVSYSDNSRN